jgi:hypothetical protein
MSKFVDAYNIIQKEPLRAIEFGWGLILFLDGLYLLAPDYQPATGSVFSQVAGSLAVAIGTAILYIVTGIASMVGSYTDSISIRKVSTGLAILSFLFTVAIRLVVVGPQPTLWVWPLTLTIVALVDNWSLHGNTRTDE